MGYSERRDLVCNGNERGAVQQERLVTMFANWAHIPSGNPEKFDPFAEALTLDNHGSRAMSNLLRPKGLGVPTEWGDATAYPGPLLNHLPGIHTWEAIGRVVSPLFEEGSKSAPDVQPASSVPSARCPIAASPTHTDSKFTSKAGRFVWE
jgi:hypothetical protein